MARKRDPFGPSMFDGLSPMEPPFQFMTIASGSSGNCTVVQAGDTVLLVDVGVSRKSVRAGLNKLGLSIEDVSGVVITHYHHDHTKHLQNIHKANSVPILASLPTLKKFGKWARGSKIELKPHRGEMVGPIKVTGTRLEHDTPGCLGLMFSCEGRNFAMATDFGSVTDDLRHFIRCSHAVLIETNYDGDMLRGSKYPDRLKMRIAGPKGHCSNKDASELICSSASEKLNVVCCGHLSIESNTPELAIGSMQEALHAKGREDICVIAAPRSEPGPVVKI